MNKIKILHCVSEKNIPLRSILEKPCGRASRSFARCELKSPNKHMLVGTGIV